MTYARWHWHRDLGVLVMRLPGAVDIPLSIWVRGTRWAGGKSGARLPVPDGDLEEALSLPSGRTLALLPAPGSGPFEVELRSNHRCLERWRFDFSTQAEIDTTDEPEGVIAGGIPGSVCMTRWPLGSVEQRWFTLDGVVPPTDLPCEEDPLAWERGGWREEVATPIRDGVVGPSAASWLGPAACTIHAHFHAGIGGRPPHIKARVDASAGDLGVPLTIVRWRLQAGGAESLWSHQLGAGSHTLPLDGLHFKDRVAIIAPASVLLTVGVDAAAGRCVELPGPFVEYLSTIGKVPFVSLDDWRPSSCEPPLPPDIQALLRELEQLIADPGQTVVDLCVRIPGFVRRLIELELADQLGDPDLCQALARTPTAALEILLEVLESGERSDVADILEVDDTIGDLLAALWAHPQVVQGLIWNPDLCGPVGLLGLPAGAGPLDAPAMLRHAIGDDSADVAAWLEGLPPTEVERWLSLATSGASLGSLPELVTRRIQVEPDDFLCVQEAYRLLIDPALDGLPEHYLLGCRPRADAEACDARRRRVIEEGGSGDEVIGARDQVAQLAHATALEIEDLAGRRPPFPSWWGDLGQVSRRLRISASQGFEALTAAERHATEVAHGAPPVTDGADDVHLRVDGLTFTRHRAELERHDRLAHEALCWLDTLAGESRIPPWPSTGRDTEQDIDPKALLGSLQQAWEGIPAAPAVEHLATMGLDAQSDLAQALLLDGMKRCRSAATALTSFPAEAWYGAATEGIGDCTRWLEGSAGRFVVRHLGPAAWDHLRGRARDLTDRLRFATETTRTRWAPRLEELIAENYSGVQSLAGGERLCSSADRAIIQDAEKQADWMAHLESVPAEIRDGLEIDRSMPVDQIEARILARAEAVLEEIRERATPLLEDLATLVAGSRVLGVKRLANRLTRARKGTLDLFDLGDALEASQARDTTNVILASHRGVSKLQQSVDKVRMELTQHARKRMSTVLEAIPTHRRDSYSAFLEALLVERHWDDLAVALESSQANEAILDRRSRLALDGPQKPPLKDFLWLCPDDEPMMSLMEADQSSRHLLTDPLGSLEGLAAASEATDRALEVLEAGTGSFHSTTDVLRQLRGILQQRVSDLQEAARSSLPPEALPRGGGFEQTLAWLNSAWAALGIEPSVLAPGQPPQALEVEGTHQGEALHQLLDQHGLVPPGAAAARAHLRVV